MIEKQDTEKCNQDFLFQDERYYNMILCFPMRKGRLIHEREDTSEEAKS